MRRWLAFCIAWLILFASPSRGQIPLDEAEISVLTFGPGPAVYERFGHIAIRLRVPSRGIDALYDWGNFDFHEPNFIGKFMKGSLLYSIEEKPTEAWLPFYRDEQDRSVIEQVLNLDDSEKARLIESLRLNLSDPKYLYDYFLDNCSTRIRDLIDRSIGGQLSPQMAGTTPHSFRWQMRRLMPVQIENKVFLTLSDFAGGPRIDLPLTQWQAAFVPMELATSLDAATITRADGSRVPLVHERRVLNTSQLPGNAEPTDASNPLQWTLPLGLLLGGITLAAARWFRIGFWTLAGAWSLFASFGVIMFTFMIFASRHWAVDWNQNYLQFSPVSLAILLAVMLPSLRRRWKRLPMIAAGLSVVGLAITISHLTIQQNAPAVGLAVPMHLALWLGWAKPSLPGGVEKERIPT